MSNESDYENCDKCHGTGKQPKKCEICHVLWPHHEGCHGAAQRRKVARAVP